MCLTLPQVLISLMGIEKLIPTWHDFEVFLQLLPRSSTGERMNPYTSFWTGVAEGDGPQEFHLVLLDNGRTGVLADQVGRQALNCIRCSRVPEHLPGLRADRRPRLQLGLSRPDRRHPDAAARRGRERRRSLPYASSLCGACYEVCPVKINIPEVLIHLRGRGRPPEAGRGRPRAKPDPEAARDEVPGEGLRRTASASSGRRSSRGSASGCWCAGAYIERLPGPLAGWTACATLPVADADVPRVVEANRGTS